MNMLDVVEAPQRPWYCIGNDVGESVVAGIINKRAGVIQPVLLLGELSMKWTRNDLVTVILSLRWRKHCVPWERKARS
jgi:hypothetical protein